MIDDSLRGGRAPYAAPQTWVLSNHDVVRHASRLGYDPVPGLLRMEGIGADDPQPDAEVGLRRARAATTVMLALPGSAYLYQGEELGLPEATQLPDDVREDPTWEKSGHTSPRPRRLPRPDAVGGRRAVVRFRPVARSPGCPSRRSYGELAVDRQAGVEGSTLELYRTLLRLRRELRLGRGELTWVDLGEHVLAFDVTTESGAPVRVIANVGGDPVPLPEGFEVLVASDELDPPTGVPTDCAVWVR